MDVPLFWPGSGLNKGGWDPGTSLAVPMNLSREHQDAIAKSSSTLSNNVNLFLCPASLLPVGYSGFREPVLLNRASSRRNARLILIQEIRE